MALFAAERVLAGRGTSPYRTAETLVPSGPSAPGQEWREWAACQHTDPRLFFVERGGSTAAESVNLHEAPIVDYY